MKFKQLNENISLLNDLNNVYKLESEIAKTLDIEDEDLSDAEYDKAWNKWNSAVKELAKKIANEDPKLKSIEPQLIKMISSKDSAMQEKMKMLIRKL